MLDAPFVDCLCLQQLLYLLIFDVQFGCLLIIVIMCSFLCHFSFRAQGSLLETKQVLKKKGQKNQQQQKLTDCSARRFLDMFNLKCGKSE